MKSSVDKIIENLIMDPNSYDNKTHFTLLFDAMEGRIVFAATFVPRQFTK